MENGLEKSKTVTKTVFWLNFAKFVIKIMVNKIMVPKINVTKFIVNQIYRP